MEHFSGKFRHKMCLLNFQDSSLFCESIVHILYNYQGFYFSGCVYEGQDHEDSSNWLANSTPCTTCMCVNGVTTCSEVSCVSPCANLITMPGECCPVCAGEQIFSSLYFNSALIWGNALMLYVCVKIAYLRADSMLQGRVSILPMIPVRSAHVR